MAHFGWPSAFYVPAVAALVWSFLWWYLVADTPQEHKTISEAERAYILGAIGDKVTKSKAMPPFKSIATSLPFLAMTVLHFGSCWGLYFILTAGPMFVKNVLGFDIKAAGVLSAFPYLARAIFSVLFGAIADFIMGKKIWSTTFIRKFFCLFSHIIPGTLLLFLVSAGCNWPISIGLLTMSMGCNGAATLTNLQNHQDLAPNYAGTLYGIANSVGSIAGFVSPMITGYFTDKGHTFENWGPIFNCGAAAYIGAAVFFIVFGTGNIQKWNYRNQPPPPATGLAAWAPWGKAATPPSPTKK
uniref:Major facilitator superfamily (MFS) profile domain-containing protein n=1 Tax=Heliothis virescens TaxID=7102 RepID=A0A2A4J4W4_HELVI